MIGVLTGPAAVLLIAAILTNGLLAGVLFAFACSVLPGLRSADDAAFVRVFRASNAAILNPAILAVFFLAPLTAVACAAMVFGRAGTVTMVWLAIGAAGALVTFAVTVVVNVPLNRRLDAVPTSTDEQYRAARQQFEPRWTRWNRIRVIAGAVATLALATAAVIG